jgi:hypothetical protein
MRIPDKIQVGPCIYEVQLFDEPFLSDDRTTVLEGQHNPHDQLIKLWVRHPDAMYVTLWHEILHAIDQMAGTELSEETIHRLAPILVSVLLDNGIVERSKVASRKS